MSGISLLIEVQPSFKVFLCFIAIENICFNNSVYLVYHLRALQSQKCQHEKIKICFTKKQECFKTDYIQYFFVKITDLNSHLKYNGPDLSVTLRCQKWQTWNIHYQILQNETSNRALQNYQMKNFAKGDPHSILNKLKTSRARILMYLTTSLLRLLWLLFQGWPG